MHPTNGDLWKVVKRCQAMLVAIDKVTVVKGADRPRPVGHDCFVKPIAASTASGPLALASWADPSKNGVPKQPMNRPGSTSSATSTAASGDSALGTVKAEGASPSQSTVILKSTPKKQVISDNRG